MEEPRVSVQIAAWVMSISEAQANVYLEFSKCNGLVVVVTSGRPHRYLSFSLKLFLFVRTRAPCHRPRWMSVGGSHVLEDGVFVDQTYSPDMIEDIIKMKENK